MALYQAELAWGIYCPWCMCLCCEGRAIWPLGKTAGFGTKRSLLQLAVLPLVWAAVPLFLVAKNQVVLSAHLQGPAIPKELLMQIIYGRGCPSLSYVFCDTHLYIAVLAVLVSV